MEGTDEPSPTTTELLVHHRITLAVYVWRGEQMRGLKWIPIEAPVGRDDVHLGTFGMRLLRDRNDAPDPDVSLYVEIPSTAWGDYVGATYTHSNARVLLDGYRDNIVKVTGDFGSETLMVPLGVEIPSGLFDAIVKLLDHSILDEDDWSQLESELAQEQWNLHGRRDWCDQIRDLAHAEGRDDDVPELEVDDYADELFWQIGEQLDVTWQAETADSGVWTDFDRAAELAWAEIQERRTAALEAWARDLAAQLPGQLCLFT